MVALGRHRYRFGDGLLSRTRRQAAGAGVGPPGRCERQNRHLGFVAVTLVVGALWGRLTWGFLAVGCPPHHHGAAVRHLHRVSGRSPPRRHALKRAKRSAVIGLIAVLWILAGALEREALAQPSPGGHRRSTPTATSTWMA